MGAKLVIQLKDKLKRYVFEIIVIFISITISFLFDGWRKGRENHQVVKKQLTLLKNDLERTSNWIDEIDEAHRENILIISDFRAGVEVNEEDLADLFWELDFNPTNFPVRELSPYLNELSSLSGTNKISNSEQIISLSSFIKTLSRVDYEENQLIVNHVNEHIWPKLSANQFSEKIVNLEKAFSDSTVTIIWSQEKYSIDMFPELETDLTYIEFRLRRILNVHDALKNNIDALTEELGKMD